MTESVCGYRWMLVAELEGLTDSHTTSWNSSCLDLTESNRNPIWQTPIHNAYTRQVRITLVKALAASIAYWAVTIWM